MGFKIICPKCKGLGKISYWFLKRKCPSCNGTGKQKTNSYNMKSNTKSIGDIHY